MNRAERRPSARYTRLSAVIAAAVAMLTEGSSASAQDRRAPIAHAVETPTQHTSVQELSSRWEQVKSYMRGTTMLRQEGPHARIAAEASSQVVLSREGSADAAPDATRFLPPLEALRGLEGHRIAVSCFSGRVARAMSLRLEYRSQGLEVKQFRILVLDNTVHVHETGRHMRERITAGSPEQAITAAFQALAGNNPEMTQVVRENMRADAPSDQRLDTLRIDSYLQNNVLTHVHIGEVTHAPDGTYTVEVTADEAVEEATPSH